MNARWQAAMAELFEGRGAGRGVEFLDEVFHLETQLAAAEG
ncbi:hypothetical protein [Tessaracoccus coleopterorum]|nr:hypothetical protein [Tessaracoccus coleopterorum]